MTGTPEFRTLAKNSLKRAKTELDSADPERLRYAALELRFAMEALTYDRALAYKADIPPEQYKTWQPRKLMGFLLTVDPHIGKTATIAFGLETEYGKPAPPENMQLLGTDNVLSLEDIKSHYDAIGSYLHMSSLEQVQTGALPDPTKLRQRCATVAGLIEKVLSSHVWNSTMGNYATLDSCMNEDCGQPITRRIAAGRTTLGAQCFACKAEYTITLEGEHKVLWAPKTTLVHCTGCPATMGLWPHEMKPGTNWHCKDCGTHNQIAMGVIKLTAPDSGLKTPA